MTGWNARFLAIFCRFAVTGAGAVFGLILWFGFLAAPTQAQQPTFEITIHPHADYAQAGQIFTYTVIITNTQTESPPNIVVKLPIPSGSNFLDTKYTNPNWLTGSNAPGSSGDVVWFSQQPIPPQQTDTFQLIVNVTAPGGETLVVDDYHVIVLDSSDGTLLASGPAIHIPVFTNPPAPKPTPSPAPMAVTPSPAPASPTATDATPAPVINTPPSLAKETPTEQRQVGLFTWLAMALSVLIIILVLAVVIFRLMRPRQNGN